METSAETRTINSYEYWIVNPNQVQPTEKLQWLQWNFSHMNNFAFALPAKMVRFYANYYTFITSLE